MGKTRNERRRKTKTIAAAKPGFLRLPAELRNVIVEYYINDFRARKVHISTDGTISGLPLAQICSQLHNDIVPMWAAQLSSGFIYCHVHNFNFHGVSRALKQLSSQAREVISAQRLLRVTLSADDDYTVSHNGTEGLKDWLKDCAAGVIPSRGIYKFTKVPIKVSTFDAVEQEVNSILLGEQTDARKEWGCVRHRYNCALIEFHNIQPYGYDMYKREEERQRREDYVTASREGMAHLGQCRYRNWTLCNAAVLSGNEKEHEDGAGLGGSEKIADSDDTMRCAMGKAKRERRFKAAQANADAAQANAEAAAQPSRLLALPAELRNKIYEFYISDKETAPILANGSVGEISLARVNHQLRREMLEMWQTQYQSAVKVIEFKVHNFDFDHVIEYLKQIPADVRDMMVSEGGKLHLTLTFSTKMNISGNVVYGRYRQTLQNWLHFCTGGSTVAVCYDFAKPLPSFSQMHAFGRARRNIFSRTWPPPRTEWDNIQYSFDKAERVWTYHFR
ncbi:hypothetical protein LTR56_011638 [Elasticomyces elasticus]|nr:hypothetical protein LTR56_011638 [Elasticomyces elasticus]KAK3647955.1 hypothetical protein LTR22_013568 [Elasticomyces elasticus]KAK4905326.1 hypothetical protein LTR49_025349 [Elasticomyces elasticus]KAK5765328.1 hypothetical protein LTS12_004585 [Elasticomyces elasticus]